MTHQARKTWIFRVNLAICALALTACGAEYAHNTPQNCDANAAVINVGDGYLQGMCGCEESGYDASTNAGEFICTISTGTVVTFLYSGTIAQHQIIPVGWPSFTPSAPTNPKDLIRVKTHTVLLNDPGTYVFTDNYNGALSGRIMVR